MKKTESWGLRHLKTKVYFDYGYTDQSGMNYFIKNMILSYAWHTESFFYATVLWSIILYMLLLWFLFTFWVMKPTMQSSFKYFCVNFITPKRNSSPIVTWRTLNKANNSLFKPSRVHLSLRFKSTGNNLGETEVFNAVRCGFARWNCRSKPRFDRGKIAANGPIVSGGTVPCNPICLTCDLTAFVFMDVVVDEEAKGGLSSV